MLTLVLTAVPAGLRGDLTKWLLEISPGVFVGNPSARVRDELWVRATDAIQDGRALLIYPDANEQGFSYRVHKHHWVPVDFDGLTLLRRPTRPNPVAQRKTGWSHAAAQQRRRRR